jgi:hypothetical protein
LRQATRQQAFVAAAFLLALEGRRAKPAGAVNSLTRFITTKLQLKVNEQKSAVARPWERKVLGFSFTNAKAPKLADRTERGDSLQGTSPGTDESDAVCRHRADGRGAGPLFAGLDRLLRYSETPSVLQSLEE